MEPVLQRLWMRRAIGVLEKPVTFFKNRLAEVLSGLLTAWYAKLTGVCWTKA